MNHWKIRVGDRIYGPLDHETAKLYARENPQAFAQGPGYSDWQSVATVPELTRRPPSTAKSTASSASPASPASPTSPTSPASTGFGSSQVTEGIDFRIHGSEMQFVEIELDPGESAVAEAGSLMYKDPEVAMTTVFGDGTNQQGGFMGRLLGAGKRLLTGEGLFTTVFTHEGQGKATVAFAAPYPGHILPIPLSSVNGQLICQKDSFLAAAKGVAIGLHFQRKILTGLFGGEGFIMQKLEGQGWCFIHAGGTLVEKSLAAGQILEVDTGCLVAMTAGVDFDIRQAGGIKTMLFGGEGLFLAQVTGPGQVWLQSLPFSRLAGRMLAGSPQAGGSRGEGSLLGGLGNFIQGDNRL